MWQEAESAMTVALITAYQCYWGEVLNAKWLNTLLKGGGGQVDVGVYGNSVSQNSKIF